MLRDLVSVGYLHKIASSAPIRGALWDYLDFLLNVRGDIRQNGCLAMYDTPWNVDSEMNLTPPSCTNKYSDVRYTKEWHLGCASYTPPSKCNKLVSSSI